MLARLSRLGCIPMNALDAGRCTPQRPEYKLAEDYFTFTEACRDRAWAARTARLDRV